MVPIGKDNIKTQIGRKAHNFPLLRPALIFSAAITDITQRARGNVQGITIKGSRGGHVNAVAAIHRKAGIA
jgi:hypothetical protein